MHLVDWRNLRTFGLLLWLATGMLGASACSETVTIRVINAQKAELRDAMKRLGGHASETHEETISAYQLLRDYLRDRELSDRRLQKLEERLEQVSRTYERLRDQLEEAEEAGDRLFALLEARAEENRTRKFRKELLRKIDQKQTLLESRLEAAADVMDALGESVQKYDDIVGYLQVNRGLGGVAQLLADVQRVIDEGGEIDQQILGHIDEGMEIIASL